jgi:hypothetical protein
MSRYYSGGPSGQGGSSGGRGGRGSGGQNGGQSSNASGNASGGGMRFAADGLDIKELLRAQLGRPSEDEYASAPDKWGISDVYGVLDSRLRLRSSNVEAGRYAWGVSATGATAQGVVGVRAGLNNVIELQLGAFPCPLLAEETYATNWPRNTSIVYGSVATPPQRLLLEPNNIGLTANRPPTLVPNAPAAGAVPETGQYPPEALAPGATTETPWLFNPFSQLPYGGSFTVQLVEAGAQAFVDLRGRHQFEYCVRYAPRALGHDPQMALAQPLPGWDTYIFTEPINIDSITLQFRTPDNPLSFPQDTYPNPSVVALEVSGSDGTGNRHLGFRLAGHGLAMGDRIFVEGFASGIAALDRHVNDVDGLVAASDPTVAPLAPGVAIPGDIFWTDPAIPLNNLVDYLGLVPGSLRNLPQQYPTLYVAKRRIRIPFRMRTLVPRETNKISP